ncbi:MAG: endonuclease/exonuclease/phosphatase family protein, partial [Myxococcota bacterium]
MMRCRRTFRALPLLVVAACAPLPEDEGEDSQPSTLDNVEYPAPRTDLVTRVGRDDAIDIATWNIENFPNNPTTPSVVADLIASLDLDVVAVQEIRDTAAFEELVARLPGFRSVLSAHTYSDGSYQKVGYLYRSDVVTLSDAVSLFQGSGYEFPRPPLQVSLQVIGTDVAFTLITLHLKAGFTADDIERRRGAAALLAGHVRGMID